MRLCTNKILEFESENQLKILNFVEEFKNTSNLIESHSGRQQRKTIFVQITGFLYIVTIVISQHPVYKMLSRSNCRKNIW